MNLSWRDRVTFFVARVLLKTLARTWRVIDEIPDDCRAIIDGSEIAVIAFWHGKMLPVWYRFREDDKVALVSTSHDGELLAQYLEKSLGYAKVIRGSSSRKGSEALSEIVSALEECSCLITPDGPQGPACEAKPGALIAAARTGRPLMTVGWSCHSSWQLKSWDTMEVPKPFAEIIIRYCKIDFLPKQKQTEQQMNVDQAPSDDEVGSEIHHQHRSDSIWIDENDLRILENALQEVSGPTETGLAQ